MADYRMMVGFWLCAYEETMFEAESDAEALEKAKATASSIMERQSVPTIVCYEDRRGGVIAWLDREGGAGATGSTVRPSTGVGQDIEFDFERVAFETADPETTEG